MDDINIKYEIAMLEDLKLFLQEAFRSDEAIHAEDVRNIAEKNGLLEQYEDLEARVSWKDEGVRVSQIVEDIDGMISLW